MASGITHIILMKYLQERLQNGNLKEDLAAGRDFLQTGAVGPDLPYASLADNDWFFATESGLADLFHYERTNQIALKAFKMIRERQEALTLDEQLYLFCFFLGFISHIVADGIVHPFVRDKVGDYARNKSDHRRLEMKLDVLLYHYLTNGSNARINFNDTDLHEELSNLVSDFYPETEKVMRFFSELIFNVYGETHSPKDILGWIQGLYRMLDVAEGKHHPLYKNLGFLDSFLFDDLDELEGKAENILMLAKPIDRDINFLHTEKIHFFHDVIPQFYKIFIPIAQKAYEYTFNQGPELDEMDVAYIDLDTGRLRSDDNNLDIIPAYWRI